MIMEEVAGQVVLCLSGREKGRFLAVVGYERGYALLSDGKERPIEKPKRKNPLHFTKTVRVLSVDELSTNRQLRKALSSFNNPGV